MVVARQSDAGSSSWPSGGKFLLYCAGISLLALVGFVVLRGRPFEFKANNEGVAFASPLTPGAGEAPREVREAESETLKKRVEETKVDRPVTEGAPFNGRWQGYGSTYVVEQHGTMVSLVEQTNGVISAAATGAVENDRAFLQAQNLLGLQFPIVLERHGRQLEIMALGQVLTLEPD
jgi:hypothetical protein